MYCCARGGRAVRVAVARKAAEQRACLHPVLHRQRQLRHVRHQLAVQQAQQRVREARAVAVAARAHTFLQRSHVQPCRLQSQQVAHGAPVLVLRRRLGVARGLLAGDDGGNARLHDLRTDGLRERGSAKAAAASRAHRGEAVKIHQLLCGRRDRGVP